MTGAVKDNRQLIRCLHCILIVRISLKPVETDVGSGSLQVAKRSGHFQVG